jgi:hypothetical protein
MHLCTTNAVAIVIDSAVDAFRDANRVSLAQSFADGNHQRFANCRPDIVGQPAAFIDA